MIVKRQQERAKREGKNIRGGVEEKESCQERMSSVLRQSGSYFTTHLTV